MDFRPLILGLLVTTTLCGQDVVPPRALPTPVEPKPSEVIQPPPGLKLGGQDRIVSSSKQFRVNGGEAADRANIVLLTEEAKSELLVLTEEEDDWKVPVSIELFGKTGGPIPLRTVVTKILITDSGFEVRLNVHLGRGIDQERFKVSVTSALVYERTLRNRPAKESETPFRVPPWLTSGLREATAWRLKQSDRRLYEALFKTGGLFKLGDLFSLSDQGFEEMDGAMRAAFKVSSGALVMALLEQPQGKAGFRAFLDEVADYQGEMPALLRKHFPELNLSETSLAKWWALQLANIGARNLATDVMSIKRTDAALEDALRLNFRTPDGIVQQKDLSAWPEIAALSEAERAESVRIAQDSLVRLSYRCFPSYRPILLEYQLILNLIAKKGGDLAPRLAALAERRIVMTAKADRAKDWLDLFEINDARETTGVFDDYMRLKERLKDHPHRRDDPLSKYLDRMDAIFSRAIDPHAPAGGTAAQEFPELPDLPPLPPLPGH